MERRPGGVAIFSFSNRMFSDKVGRSFQLGVQRLLLVLAAPWWLLSTLPTRIGSIAHHQGGFKAPPKDETLTGLSMVLRELAAAATVGRHNSHFDLVEENENQRCGSCRLPVNVACSASRVASLSPFPERVRRNEPKIANIRRFYGTFFVFVIPFGDFSVKRRPASILVVRRRSRAG